MDFICSADFADIIDLIFDRVDAAGYLSLMHVSKYVNEKITNGGYLERCNMPVVCSYQIGKGNIKFARWLHECCGLPVRYYESLRKYPCDDRWEELEAWLITLDKTVQIDAKLAISSGKLAIFEYCINATGDNDYTDFWYKYIMKQPNRVQMLNMMADKGKKICGLIWKYLVESGLPDTDDQVSKWLIAAGSKPCIGDITSAAERGLFRMMEIMINVLAEKSPDDRITLDNLPEHVVDGIVVSALVYQNISILQLVSPSIHEDMPRTEIIEAIVKAGHKLSPTYLVKFIINYDEIVVNYLLENGCPISYLVEEAAIISNNVQLLRKLKQLGVPNFASSVKHAARVGNFELLDCLMQHTIPSIFDSDNVVLAGNLEMLQQFIKSGYYVHSDAVYHGKPYDCKENYKLLEWLLVEYPPADPLCRFIRHNFHRRLGRYASCVNIPNDIDALSKWCQDVLLDSDIDDLYDFLDATSHVSGTVDVCNKHKFDAGKWSPAIVAKLAEYAACYGSTLVVKELFAATNCNTTIQDIVIAIGRRNMDMIKFLVSQYLRDGSSFANDDKTGWLLMEAFKTPCAVNLLNFLRNNGVHVVPELYNIALQMYDIDDGDNHIRWLHTVGCQLPTNISMEVSDDNLIIMKQGISNGRMIYTTRRIIPLTA